MADKETPVEPDGSEPFKPYGNKANAASKPVVAPDGHVNLSAEDIKERDADS